MRGEAAPLAHREWLAAGQSQRAGDPWVTAGERERERKELLRKTECHLPQMMQSPSDQSGGSSLIHYSLHKTLTGFLCRELLNGEFKHLWLIITLHHQPACRSSQCIFFFLFFFFLGCAHRSHDGITHLLNVWDEATAFVFLHDEWAPLESQTKKHHSSQGLHIVRLPLASNTANMSPAVSDRKSKKHQQLQNHDL